MVKELQIQSLIRDVPNFPKQGIVFKDITPLLAHPEARKSVVEEIANNYQDQKIDAIAAVEAVVLFSDHF
jgi:adenine phosphoribosyltransferase